MADKSQQGLIPIATAKTGFSVTPANYGDYLKELVDLYNNMNTYRVNGVCAAHVNAPFTDPMSVSALETKFNAFGTCTCNTHTARTCTCNGRTLCDCQAQTTCECNGRTGCSCNVNYGCNCNGRSVCTCNQQCHCHARTATCTCNSRNSSGCQQVTGTTDYWSTVTSTDYDCPSRSSNDLYTDYSCTARSVVCTCDLRSGVCDCVTRCETNQSSYF